MTSLPGLVLNIRRINQSMYASVPAQGPNLSRVSLHAIISADLAVFFNHQQDPEANTMAAFTAKDPGDWQAFTAHWQKILADEAILLRTILFEGHCAGYVLSHAWFGQPELSYWIGKLAGLRVLIRREKIKPREQVVLIITSHGYKDPPIRG